MIDWEFILIIAGFAGLLVTASIELVNLWFLKFLYNWANSVGVRLIEQVKGALNLKAGSDEPLSDQILGSIKSGQIQETIREVAGKNPELAKEIQKQIDPAKILLALGTGQLKMSEVRGLIPVFLEGFFEQKESNPQSKGNDW